MPATADASDDDSMDDVAITSGAATGDTTTATPRLDADDSLDSMDDVDVDAAESSLDTPTANAYARLYDLIDTPEQTTPSTPLQVVLNAGATPATPRRKSTPWTPRDRRNRTLVHQLHALAILAAARMRNAWCNDPALRDVLQDMVPGRLLHKLHAIHPKREPERRERIRLFEAFMQDLVHWWAARFRLPPDVCAAAAWRQPSQDLLLGVPLPPGAWEDGWITESPADRARWDRYAADDTVPAGGPGGGPVPRQPASPRTLRASSMRAAPRVPPGITVFPPGNDTRIPTYLRLLPPPEKVHSPATLVAAANARTGSQETSAMLFCALCRSLGVPARLVVSMQVSPWAMIAVARADTRRPDDLMTSDEGDDAAGEACAEEGAAAEVFSKPYQRWVTADPVRGFIKVTGNKGMEPLPGNRQNRLVYVVAWEEDGYARDVTARYTRTLHGRVARHRPSARTRGGEDWWTGVVRAMHRPQKLDRDAVEDAELADTAAREPMPTSVAAFKDHPVYALERHLRRDEVLHPVHRVGTFQGLPVYLRAHVVHVQSTRQWYNEGRAVVDGAQPLKTVAARPATLHTRRVNEQLRAEHGEHLSEDLYARFQTEVYVPPPVHDGVVPTNQYGRVDLFVPSMLPIGAAHIPHPLAAKAARSLHIGHAEAIVGFDFRKQRSVPRVAGVVVPADRAAEMQQLLDEMQRDAAHAARQKRQTRALKHWRSLLTALTVADHVRTSYGGGEAAAEARAATGPGTETPMDGPRAGDMPNGDPARSDGRGGFFPTFDARSHARAVLRHGNASAVASTRSPPVSLPAPALGIGSAGRRSGAAPERSAWMGGDASWPSPAAPPLTAPRSRSPTPPSPASATRDARIVPLSELAECAHVQSAPKRRRIV
ncbi:hypothetical protein MSPP1_003881 [Malassezia sp. CBS 17886]|nr:hypothetical protein MSPP1_003881 [Malassezia sp. CBS 17886]